MIINPEVVKMFHYISSQNEEQKVSTYHGHLTCRYGYGRAMKTALQGRSGQDFLGVHIKDDICNFVVCDGIGTSNQGNSTTRYLGNTLMDWLDSTIDWSSKEFLSYMEYIPVIAMKELQNPTPLDTMYICGRIELPTLEKPIGRIWMAWQGVSRLRFWRNGLEVSQYFKGTMRKEEWWSISEGPLGGSPHVYQSRLEYGIPMRLQVYTDGLHDLDPIHERLPDEQIQILLDAPHTDGLIEDAAFLELEW
ncbi:hypothetical protein PGLA_16765 [Paenibacillus glacialis]|uniref:PPM-type phosphatase domain-containing protein n=2 Tax=Paenibacillus glacialis TaxID=494026 RepID=A0A168K2R7_9BACL|nr:hypothetical protein PGLA_16765 [Paenibacillus glacialis]